MTNPTDDGKIRIAGDYLQAFLSCIPDKYDKSPSTVLRDLAEASAFAYAQLTLDERKFPSTFFRTKP